MLYNIAEPDKAYDKCHHLLNPFKSNETSHFYQIDQSIFVFRVVGCCFHSYSNFDRIPCKQNSREPDQTLQSVASDLGLYYLSMSHKKKNPCLIWVKYFCCIRYSHQLYCFFIELDNDCIWSGFNHMNRHGVCHIRVRNRYD